MDHENALWLIPAIRGDRSPGFPFRFQKNSVSAVSAGKQIETAQGSENPGCKFSFMGVIAFAIPFLLKGGKISDA